MNTKPIKILIVEDSPLVRRGIRSLLETSTDLRIDVVGEATSNAEAIIACDQLTPDIVLLDIRLSDGLGFEACKEILKRQPDTKIIVLTSHSTDSFVYEAVTAGVHGYLMKEIDPVGLFSAIQDVAAGKSILAPDVTTRILNFLRSGSLSPDNHNELASLSPQEKRVLALVAEGFTNKQIGVELNLSENTVKNYLIKVFEKLQVNRRAQAAAIYVQNTKNTPHESGASDSRFNRNNGFSLVEVMVASFVLVLGITTAITTLQQGFKAVDTARNFSYSAQLMQSEMEKLRLKNWSQLQALQDAGTTNISTDDTASAARTVFTCSRVITDVKTDMKQITLISNWQGYDGRAHTARFITRYSKSGLYDYLYTSH